jgi:hypothetical protein
MADFAAVHGNVNNTAQMNAAQMNATQVAMDRGLEPEGEPSSSALKLIH